MKSEHRHELETNWLAKRLAVVIDQLRPYTSTVVGIVAALAVVLVGMSYFSGESAARRSAAWDTFNQAVEAGYPDLDMLRESAEEHAGTPMQKWADITWADGQLWRAAQYYMQQRPISMDDLQRAESSYRSLLQETDEPQLVSRAHFGLGRVYEFRNELDKARAEYSMVQGGFAALAKQRAELLAKQETKDTYAWLATAEVPRPRVPSGPGTPGQRPAFSAGDLDLPASGTPETTATPVEDLFKAFGVPEEPADRYGEGGGAATPSGTATGDAKAATDKAVPVPPAADVPAKKD
jgi:hypothetical protein